MAGHFTCASCGTVVPEKQCSPRELAFLEGRRGECDQCDKGERNMANRGGEPIGARELEVPAQLGQLDEAITRLGEAVHGLVKRLEPVSQASIPTPTKETGPNKHPDQIICDVGGKIRGLRHQVNTIREVVEAQVARLEI